MNLQRYFHLFRSHRSLRATIARKDASLASLEKLLLQATKENEQLTDRLTLANHLIFKQGADLASAEAQVKAVNSAGLIVLENYETMTQDNERMRSVLRGLRYNAVNEDNAEAVAQIDSVLPPWAK